MKPIDDFTLASMAGAIIGIVDEHNANAQTDTERERERVPTLIFIYIFTMADRKRSEFAVTFHPNAHNSLIFCSSHSLKKK